MSVPPRRRALRGPAAALAIVLVVAVAAPAAAVPNNGRRAAQNAATTSVRVLVTDEDGAGVGNQEVFVVVTDGDQVVRELTGSTEADGSLRFDDVPAGGGHAARAVAVYQGYPYQSESTELMPGVEAILPLPVAAVGSGEAQLHINVLHLIINVVQPGLYQVIQLVEALNVAERPGYSGEEFQGRPVGMIIPVPSLATGIAPVDIDQVGNLDPGNLALDGNRLLDLRPVPPGSSQIAIQYELATGADGADIELVLPYPTSQVSILAGPGLDAVELESEQLDELAPADIPQQGPYANWSSDVLDAGETLRFRLGPQGPAISVEQWSLLGLALALLASALASLWGGRQPGSAGERRRLIAEVARLDRDHDAGAIGDADYHARRAEAIGRLLELQPPTPAEPGAPDD